MIGLSGGSFVGVSREFLGLYTYLGVNQAGQGLARVVAAVWRAVEVEAWRVAVLDTAWHC